jgi:hypothetical protein
LRNRFVEFDLACALLFCIVCATAPAVAQSARKPVQLQLYVTVDGALDIGAMKAVLLVSEMLGTRMRLQIDYLKAAKQTSAQQKTRAQKAIEQLCIREHYSRRRHWVAALRCLLDAAHQSHPFASCAKKTLRKGNGVMVRVRYERLDECINGKQGPKLLSRSQRRAAAYRRASKGSTRSPVVLIERKRYRAPTYSWNAASKLLAAVCARMPAKAKPAACSSPATAQAARLPSIGVPICDLYLSALMQCAMTRMPARMRPLMRSTIGKIRASWKTQAATPTSRKHMDQGCRMALKMSVKSMARFKCVWPTLPATP